MKIDKVSFTEKFTSILLPPSGKRPDVPIQNNNNEYVNLVNQPVKDEFVKTDGDKLNDKPEDNDKNKVINGSKVQRKYKEVDYKTVDEQI